MAPNGKVAEGPLLRAGREHHPDTLCNPQADHSSYGTGAVVCYVVSCRRQDADFAMYTFKRFVKPRAAVQL